MEEMKSVLKDLQNNSCRTRELSDHEVETFSNIQHLQRYFPALDVFNLSEIEYSQKNIELPSKYFVHLWESKDGQHPRIWNAFRQSMDSTTSSEPCKVFTKVIHLLNPIDMLKKHYYCPEHPLLPQSDQTWKSTLLKLHSRNNQAYVDAVANFVMSRFRELDLSPHCVLYYGSYTGIDTKYSYNISGEFDTYRQCRWFWNGIKSLNGRITLSHVNEIEKNTRYKQFYEEITTCPFDLDNAILDLDPFIENDENNDTLSIASIESCTFDDIQEQSDTEDNTTEDCQSNNEISDDSISDNSSHNSSDFSDLSDGSDSSEIDIDVCLQIPNMPVILIAQEAQEGVMDALLDEDELDNQERGTTGWETRWIAWLFQVIATLSFLQSTINFTHNDLHANNIVWRKTDKKYLYYKAKDKTIWRIPTFGKIFSIIDFGRSIFRLGKHQWISDDHWPDQDAGDQYNFGPFYDPSKPKVLPNPSFDLCRLAISLINGLFDEPPRKKKGKNVQILSEEGSWKVYETCSPLYNLLWSWTVDDAGRTVYEDKDGDEKYEGFELYIRIAHDVHNSVPKEQLYHPVFKSYIWDKKVPQTEKIYSVGA
jgi:hypothetical protein